MPPPAGPGTSLALRHRLEARHELLGLLLPLRPELPPQHLVPVHDADLPVDDLLLVHELELLLARRVRGVQHDARAPAIATKFGQVDNAYVLQKLRVLAMP